MQQQNDLQLRFQTQIGRANVGLSAMRVRVGEDRQDTRYAATLSIPLGTAPRAPRLSSLGDFEDEDFKMAMMLQDEEMKRVEERRTQMQKDEERIYLISQSR